MRATALLAEDITTRLVTITEVPLLMVWNSARIALHGTIAQEAMIHLVSNKLPLIILQGILVLLHLHILLHVGVGIVLQPLVAAVADEARVVHQEVVPEVEAVADEDN